MSFPPQDDPRLGSWADPGEARRPEILSYLFFAGLIATTFLI